MKAIIVDIDSNGAVSINAEGFRGSTCVDATRFLETALGVIQERHKKPEYNARVRTSQRLGRDR